MDRKLLRLAILMLTVMLPAMLFAGGSREVVTKVILTAPISYISPVSTVDEKKTLSISGIQLQIDKNGVIKKYEFSVYDKTGKVVYTKAEENLQGRGFLGDALNIGTVPSVKLPSAIGWDAKDSTGTQVPDGEYTYQLTATDNWGFTASSAPLSVVVDTKPPTIQTLTTSRSVVSPDGDGKNDNLIFKHLTGPAANWIEEIKDASGNSIYSKEYKSDSIETQMAESTEWDPSPQPVLPEGTYTYTVRGLDFAANAVEKSVTFKVSYATGDISLESDGTKIVFDSDTRVTLTASTTASAGATKWKLEIEDSSGVVWRRFAGNGLVQGSVSFDGRGNARDPSQGTDKLRDGTYTAVVTQEYESGLEISSTAVDVVIDNSKPVEIVQPTPTPTPTEQPYKFYLPSIDVDTAPLFELGSADQNPVTFTISGVQKTDKLNWKLTVTDGRGNELWFVDNHTAQQTDESTENYGDDNTNGDDTSGNGSSFVPAASAEVGAVDPGTEIASVNANGDVAVRAQPATVVVSAEAGDDAPMQITWDGKDNSGSIIPGAQAYQAVLSFYDENGNSLGQISKTFVSSIPVVKDGGYLKISVPDVLFDGNDTNPVVIGEDQREANRIVLQRLGVALAQAASYKIILAGYATYTNGFTPTSMDKEQRLELIPLSEKRATKVKEALYLFGVDWDRFGVLARGGTDPVVPYTDLVNRYLNRRVVFLLEQ